MDNAARYGLRWSTAANAHPVPNPLRRYVADAYQAKADDTTSSVDLNIGDPVKRVTDGTIALANLGDAVYGVIVGIEPYWNGSAMQPTNRLPGGTTGGGLFERRSAVLVVPAQAGYWECDCDEAGVATTEAGFTAFIGENVDVACVADITNASQPKANPRIDISTHDPASRQWRIEYVSGTRDNQDFAGLNVKLILRINESQETAAMSTTGT